MERIGHSKVLQKHQELVASEKQRLFFKILNFLPFILTLSQNNADTGLRKLRDEMARQEEFGLKTPQPPKHNTKRVVTKRASFVSLAWGNVFWGKARKIENDTKSLGKKKALDRVKFNLFWGSALFFVVLRV